MERSDEYLLGLALQGESASFGELVHRWERKIYGFICRYVGNSEVAKDLTQDTFTKAYLNLERLSDPARFSPWLYKIALNECRMRQRREGKVRRVSIDSESEVHQLRSRDSTPETSVLQRERVRNLRNAINGLPEEQRLVILMKEYQGLKFEEISQILEVPLSTAKSRMYLGLKTLRKMMESQG